MCYRELYGLLDLHAYPHNIKYVEIYILYILLLSLIRTHTTRQSSSAIKTLTGNEIMELKSSAIVSEHFNSFFFFFWGGGVRHINRSIKPKRNALLPENHVSVLIFRDDTQP